MKIGGNKQEQLLFTIHSGNGPAAQQALSMILFCYSNEIDLIKLDENGRNAIHYVCESGNYKLAQLVLSSFHRDKEKLKQIMAMGSKFFKSRIPLVFAAESKSKKTVEVVLQYGFGIQDSHVSDELIILFMETADKQLYSSDKNKISHYCKLALLYMLEQEQSDDSNSKSKQNAMKWLIEHINEEKKLFMIVTKVIAQNRFELLEFIVNRPMVDMKNYSVSYDSITGDKTIKDSYGIESSIIVKDYKSIQLEAYGSKKYSANACELCLFNRCNLKSNTKYFEIVWQKQQQTEKKMKFDHVLQMLSCSLELEKNDIFNYFFDSYIEPTVSTALKIYNNNHNNNDDNNTKEETVDPDAVLTKKYFKALSTHVEIREIRIQVGCTLVLNTAARKCNQNSVESLLKLPLFNPNCCRNYTNGILHCASKPNPLELKQQLNNSDVTDEEKEVKTAKNENGDVEIEKLQHLECFKLLLSTTKCNSQLYKSLNNDYTHGIKAIEFCQRFPSRIMIRLVDHQRYDCVNYFLTYIENIKLQNADKIKALQEKKKRKANKAKKTTYSSYYSSNISNDEFEEENVSFMTLDPEVCDTTIAIDGTRNCE